MNERLLWLASAVTSIITSKRLVVGEIHYPLHLLSYHLAAFAFFRTICRFFKSRNKANAFFGNPPGSKDGPTLLYLVRTVLLGLGLAFGYKALVYFKNLPALAVLLVLDWHPDDFLRKLLRGCLGRKDVARYLILATGVFLICYSDRRLNAVGQELLVALIIIFGLIQLLNAAIVNSSVLPKFLQRSYWPIESANWMSALVVPIGFWAWNEETIHSRHWGALSLTKTVYLNFASTVLALSLGGTGLSNLWRPRQFHPGQKLLALAFTGCVALGSSVFLTHPIILSRWQYAGLVLSSVAFLKRDDISTLKSSTAPVVFVGRTPAESDSDGPPKSRRSSMTSSFSYASQQSRRTSLALLALAAISWMGFLARTLSLQRPPVDYSKITLDNSFKPTIDLDIVVSHYNEPINQMFEDLDELLHSSSLRGLRSRVVIYTKHESTDQTLLDRPAEQLGETNVRIEHMENIGRDSDTYLHHIVSRWDDMAAQTLFIQAEVHYLPLVKATIENYFVPETGFLSLSYECVVCQDCDTCHDTFWSEAKEVLEGIYSKANGGAQCQDLVLTYRGQFIASGRRIRGNPKTMYEELLNEFRDPGSKMHAQDYIQKHLSMHEQDSLSNPIFGFTIERMWGVIMQCSSVRVGYWSPSMLAGYTWPSWLGSTQPFEDIQCLDESRS